MNRVLSLHCPSGGQHKRASSPEHVFLKMTLVTQEGYVMHVSGHLGPILKYLLEASCVLFFFCLPDNQFKAPVKRKIRWPIGGQRIVITWHDTGVDFNKWSCGLIRFSIDSLDIESSQERSSSIWDIGRPLTLGSFEVLARRYRTNAFAVPRLKHEGYRATIALIASSRCAGNNPYCSFIIGLHINGSTASSLMTTRSRNFPRNSRRISIKMIPYRILKAIPEPFLLWKGCAVLIGKGFVLELKQFSILKHNSICSIGKCLKTANSVVLHEWNGPWIELGVGGT
jgi:hypothetical protein